MFLAAVPELAGAAAEVGMTVAADVSELGAATAGEVGGNVARTMVGDLGSSMSDVGGAGTRGAGGFTKILAQDSASDAALGDREALPGGDSSSAQPSNSLSSSLTRIADSDSASSDIGESREGGNSSLIDSAGGDLEVATRPSDQADQDQKEIERRNSQRSSWDGKEVRPELRLPGKEEGEPRERGAEGREDVDGSRAQGAADSRERILSEDTELTSPNTIRERAAQQLKNNLAEDVRENPDRFDVQRTARVEAEASQQRAAQETAEASQQRVELERTPAATNAEPRAELELRARSELEPRAQVGHEENTPIAREEAESHANQTEPGKELELYKQPVEDGEATEPRLPAVRGQMERVEQAEAAEILDAEIVENEHPGRSEQQLLRDQERAMEEAIVDAEIVDVVEGMDEAEVRMADREAEARARREEEQQQAQQKRTAEEEQRQQEEILDLSQGEIISDEQYREIQEQRQREEQWEREQDVQAIIEQEQMRLRMQAARDGYVQSEADGLDEEWRIFNENQESAGPAKPEPRMVGDETEPNAAQPAPRGEGGDEGMGVDEGPGGTDAMRGRITMPNSSTSPENLRANSINSIGNLRIQMLSVDGTASAQTTNQVTRSPIRNFLKKHRSQIRDIGFNMVLTAAQGMASNMAGGAEEAEDAARQA